MAKVRYQVVTENGQQIVKEIHKIVFHKIKMGDVEDPDLMVADPIWKWQQTEPGEFVMKHAVEGSPSWHRQLDIMGLGHIYYITAEMEHKKLAEYYLKWGKPE